jgi:hypothetical protein
MHWIRPSRTPEKISSVIRPQKRHGQVRRAVEKDIEWRKEVAENTELGFKLPSVEGSLGLPKQKKSELKKVA